MFHATMNKGFQMEIGQFTISVQWGPGNYCEKRSFGSAASFSEPMRTELWSSKDAEIAIWETKGRDQAWVPCSNGDNVRGWLTAMQVAKVIAFMSREDIADGNTSDARSKLSIFVQDCLEL